MQIRFILTFSVLLSVINICEAGTIVFDTKVDWEQWSSPKGTVVLTADGRIRPVFIRKNINVCLDAGRFIAERDKAGKPVRWGGIKGAGSDSSRAKNIIDGDDATSWGPQWKDGPDNWWVEIDLGRFVLADSIRVVFSRQGSPFEQFKIYVSDGKPAFATDPSILDYELVARTTQPTTAYTITYPLPPRKQMRYIRLILTAWSRPEDDPELSEIEVFSIGDNVALGTFERGGSATAIITGGTTGRGEIVAMPAVVDGDAKTKWNASMERMVREGKHGWAHIDLGNQFWIDTITIIGAPFDILTMTFGPLTGYELDVSDGSKASSMEAGSPERGPYIWEQVGYLPRNPPEGIGEELYYFEHTFPLRPVRRIFLQVLLPPGQLILQLMHVKEIQAYGYGYLPTATMTSGFIDLKNLGNLTTVSWVAETPPETKIEIRTRTGDQLLEQKRYYDTDGKEILGDTRRTAEENYNKLPAFRRGRIDTETIAGDDWSGWSQTYLSPGDRFLSPSPRRYLQIEAKLISKNPDVAPSLDRVAISFTDPFAKVLIGEIWPVRVDRAAVPQNFSYFFRATPVPGGRGFDRILIRTPSRPDSTRIGVRIGEGAQNIRPSSVKITDDSLLIQLPRAITGGEVVEVQFMCTVFLSGTIFEAFVGRTDAGDVYQRVDAGDATASVNSSTIVVAVPVSDEMIGNVTISPETVTPNGDGVNDETSIMFSVFKVDASRQIRLVIHDLAGHVVRKLVETFGTGGSYRTIWDGQDASGRIVPPGLYICRIEVETDTGTAHVDRIIGVVY